MSGFVAPYFAGRLATLNEAAGGVGFMLLTSDYIPSTEDEYVSDVEQYEVSAPGYQRHDGLPIIWSSSNLTLGVGFGVVPTFDVEGADDIRHVVAFLGVAPQRIISIMSWDTSRDGFDGFAPFGEEPDNQIFAAVVQTSGVEQIRAGDGIAVDSTLPASPRVSAVPVGAGAWEPFVVEPGWTVESGEGVRLHGGMVELSAAVLGRDDGSAATGDAAVVLPEWARPDEPLTFIGFVGSSDGNGIIDPGFVVSNVSEDQGEWVLSFGGPVGASEMAGWAGVLSWPAR